jgi:mannose/cellobiose epimerase-like protein (N-acyl-D-glucosamine 2-epimerase family)
MSRRRVSRRVFLGAAAAAPSALAAGVAPAVREASALTRRTHSDLRLAGYSLAELRDLYRRDLFDDYLPFVDRHVFDHERGGFMCEVDLDGRLVSTRKSSWFDGRGLWVHSFLYSHFGRDPRQLEIARKTAALLLRVGPWGPDGLWPRSYTREGKPIESSDGEIYGDLFVAEGLAEFARATGEQPYAGMARDLVMKCVRLYDRPDYRPAIGRTYLGPGAPPFPGARILGVWMVLLRLSTQMLAGRPDPEIEAVARRAVDAIMNAHFNPAFELLNELLNHDLSRPDDEYRQLVYTGHGVEVLWMVLDEARRRGDNALFDLAAERYRRHIAVAWDDVYGGVLRNLQHVDRNVWLVDKVLWAQEEVLIGTLLLVEAGVEWAAEEFSRMYRYVRSTYPLASRGVPLWMYAGNRRMDYDSFLALPRRLENYHHPRHLLLNLTVLDRLVRDRIAPEIGGACS